MDFNGDRQLWVQAQAVVRGRPRNVVARLKLELLSESVPQAGVVAGALDVTNNGNKLMIDGTGSSDRGALLARHERRVRETTTAGKGQLTPAPRLGPGQPNFMTAGPARALQGAGHHRWHLLPGRHLPQRRGAAHRRGGMGRAVQRRATRTSAAYSTPCVVPAGMASQLHQPDDQAGHADLALRHVRADRQLDLLRDHVPRQQLRRHVRELPGPKIGLPHRASTRPTAAAASCGALVVDGARLRRDRLELA